MLNVPQYMLLVAFLIFTTSSRELRANFIIDHFENQPVGSGIGTPLNYFSFGNQLSDRGVSDQFGATSGSRSAFYAIDFDAIGFGVGASHMGLSLAVQSTDLIQVQLKSTSLALNRPFVAFRIEDRDGTVLRTPDTDLLNASLDFQTLSQSISKIQLEDVPGTRAGFDYNDVTSVGLLFYDRDFTGSTTIIFDDLTLVSVPEPSSFALTLLSLSFVFPKSIRGFPKRCVGGLRRKRGKMPPQTYQTSMLRK